MRMCMHASAYVCILCMCAYVHMYALLHDKMKLQRFVCACVGRLAGAPSLVLNLALSLSLSLSLSLFASLSHMYTFISNRCTQIHHCMHTYPCARTCETTGDTDVEDNYAYKKGPKE
jgi:hypothetical protein